MHLRLVRFIADWEANAKSVNGQDKNEQNLKTKSDKSIYRRYYLISFDF